MILYRETATDHMIVANSGAYIFFVQYDIDRNMAKSSKCLNYLQNE